MFTLHNIYVKRESRGAAQTIPRATFTYKSQTVGGYPIFS